MQPRLLFLVSLLLASHVKTSWCQTDRKGRQDSISEARLVLGKRRKERLMVLEQYFFISFLDRGKVRDDVDR